MPSKPLLFADDVPAADKRAVELKYVREEFDKFYIPGYSEVVKANDLSKNRAQIIDQAGQTKQDYYQRWGTGPRDLPFEFVWVRVTDPAGRTTGTNIGIDRFHYTEKGYRPCTVQDFERLKEKLPTLDFPPAAEKAEDGTIRIQDSALFVVDTNDRRFLLAQRDLAEANRAALNPRSDRRGDTTGTSIDAWEEESGYIED